MKKVKKSSREIEKFNFDPKREFKIYEYLVEGKVKDEGVIKDFKFERYADWERYVIDKNKIHNKEELREFSRHLKYKIGKNTAFLPIIIMYFSPVVSYFLTYYIDSILNPTASIIELIIKIVAYPISVVFMLVYAYKMWSIVKQVDTIS